ncbi:hypothetical protein MA16_Dca002779 [Dendrobium catenatum]|uniref:Uncharacterized protein n=1 Tax=Dendrobium catenatum TaxID=906689 RepID=A0A2I0X8P4_9ASPA|nr:hypothetical protein MA16_Dca002779 [Dendrobium catenatum]
MLFNPCSSRSFNLLISSILLHIWQGDSKLSTKVADNAGKREATGLQVANQPGTSTQVELKMPNHSSFAHGMTYMQSQARYRNSVPLGTERYWNSVLLGTARYRAVLELGTARYWNSVPLGIGTRYRSVLELGTVTRYCSVLLGTERYWNSVLLGIETWYRSVLTYFYFNFFVISNITL